MSDLGHLSIPDENGRTGWAELGFGGTVQVAKPSARLGARLLDGILVFILWIVVIIAVPGISFDSTNGSYGILDLTMVVWQIVGILFTIAYEIWPTARWGQTLGKRIMGIKVVHAATGEAPGWGKSFGRWAVPTLPATLPFVQYIGWIFTVLCYLSLGHDPVYQGWHDKAAGTLVVRR